MSILGQLKQLSHHFFDACKSGDVNSCLYFLRFAYFNTNSPDSEGITPLLHAISNLQIEIVRLILLHPMTDPNRRAKKFPFLSPLEKALELGNDACLKLLVDHPLIDLNDPRGIYHPPLSLASLGRIQDFIFLALSPGVNLDALTQTGHSLISTFIEAGTVRHFMVLFALGAKIDDPNITIKAKSETLKTKMAHELNCALSFPEKTRSRYIRELGLQDKMAADTFALVILFSDGFLALKPVEE